MKLFKNLSIKNKIMLGIGLTFILSMFFLLGIVIYQFNDLSAENQSLIEKELLERKYDKYQTLVEKRAEILSKSYHLYLEEKAAEDKSVTESEIRNTISELIQSQTVSDMYYFIYDL